jgi:hypothetical protein
VTLKQKSGAHVPGAGAVAMDIDVDTDAGVDVADDVWVEFMRVSLHIPRRRRIDANQSRGVRTNRLIAIIPAYRHS